MQEKIKQRLQDLNAEYETGQKAMADLRNKQENLHETLLRITGAIQVLQELNEADPEAPTQVQQRLQDLNAEYETGQKAMADLGDKQENLHQTLLRISGAIQVLQELDQELEPVTAPVDAISDASTTTVQE